MGLGASLLRAVECRVGLGVQRPRVNRARLGETHRKGGLSRDLHARGHRLDHPPRHELGLVQAGLDEHERELVASDAECLVAAPPAREDPADLGEHGVPARMAVAVVDRLEAVHVEQREREQRAVASGAAGLADQRLVVGAPVAEPGERVAAAVVAHGRELRGVGQVRRDHGAEQPERLLVGRVECLRLRRVELEHAHGCAVGVLERHADHGHRAHPEAQPRRPPADRCVASSQRSSWPVSMQSPERLSAASIRKPRNCVAVPEAAW